MHAIPRVDSFSSSIASKPWFAWEWLYDVVVGKLEAAFGLNGVVWFTAVTIAAVLAWLFRWLIARGANFFAAFFLVLLATAASMIHWLARPHVVSWLFTLGWFWILDSAERDEANRRRLWLLPLVMLVWANVHGGFLIGLVLLGIFFVSAIPPAFAGPHSRLDGVLRGVAARRRARELVSVGVLSFLASLINPYGWELYRHIYSYLSNRFLMNHIDEFQSPNFHGVAQKCFLALLLIAVAVVWRRGRDLRLSEGLTILFAMYAGLYATRNIPVAAILLVMVIGPHLPMPRFVGEFSRRMTAVELGLRGHGWALAALIVTLLIAVNGGRVGSAVWMDAHFDAKRMPVAAVDFVASHGLQGPALSPDYWGGYLIYRLYPGTKVVVDDRHDFYGEEFFRSYLKMVHGERAWDGFLKEHPARNLVLPSDAVLTNLLAGDTRWKEVYRDEAAVVFENESKAKE